MIGDELSLPIVDDERRLAGNVPVRKWIHRTDQLVSSRCQLRRVIRSAPLTMPTFLLPVTSTRSFLIILNISVACHQNRITERQNLSTSGVDAAGNPERSTDRLGWLITRCACCWAVVASGAASSAPRDDDRSPAIFCEANRLRLVP